MYVDGKNIPWNKDKKSNKKKQISETTYKTANSNIKSHIYGKNLKIKSQTRKKKQNCQSENNKYLKIGCHETIGLEGIACFSTLRPNSLVRTPKISCL